MGQKQQYTTAQMARGDRKWRRGRQQDAAQIKGAKGHIAELRRVQVGRGFARAEWQKGRARVEPTVWAR